ncbi:TIGR04283 family arsenosugar biosynthesis glycosyltransferase [Microcoleus sp. LEGE 07076]|uniref:TIGR04283 family arsenosugar biosynthesis glycosyltransferase n=1 Tax=Microcoleus sp. LEGE 07076 TaxID=915322 RepID=UPI0018822FBC|nr:TIGR04283 family arsenosugar biosynthesis glycosyltransferase [Microcoleus sp. LEGE 07076]MBE9183585.1 TIGR04283 family arsenosugar biosynthesis glycosyltransferase [Microcoleus sp. LEGE 07076]
MLSENPNLKISIIIPALNEAPTIAPVISTARNAKNVEIIVADGGSSDGTASLAQSLGVRVISTAPGRATQMNAGAASATGDILLFLHADTLLPRGYDSGARRALAKPHTVGGAFELKIDARRLCLRLVETGVNCRSNFLQMPYGDQAIFLYSATFEKIGGFPDLPLMEDFEFVRRLKKQGHIVILPQPVLTSDRRWQQLGVLKTTAINQIVIIAYFLGVSPDRLAFWYRGQKKNSSEN